MDKNEGKKAYDAPLLSVKPLAEPRLCGDSYIAMHQNRGKGADSE